MRFIYCRRWTTDHRVRACNIAFSTNILTVTPMILSKNKLFPFFFTLMLGQNVWAQALQGVVTYGVEYKVNLPDRPDLDMYQSMMPDAILLSLKEANSLMQVKGGMTDNLIGDILYKAKEKAIYSLTPATKTAVKTPISDLYTAGDRSFKAVKTTETAPFLGYKCTKYIIKDEQEGTETWVWSAPITNASASLMVYFLESMTQYKIANVQGLPLKIEFKGKEFDLTIVSQKIEKKALPTSLFVIPKDYKISRQEN